ncbi:MAG: hypothetical protein V4726_08140 [Verrucomicrobiota bacterium]
MSLPTFSRKTGLILAASALAGGFTGWLLRSSGSTAAAATGPRQKITAASAAPGSRTGGKQMLPQTRIRLDALWKPGTPSGQIAAALEFASLNSVDEIRDLLDNSFRFPSHSGEEVAIGTLLKRWLELNPQEALKYCRQQKPEFLARLAGNWSVAHPDEAAAWAKALPAGENQQAVWMELCKAATARDPDKAWEMLARTPSLNLERGTWQIDGVVSRMVAQDVEKAIAGMASMPPSILAAARKAIAAELMRTDPRRGWDWARQQPNPRETMGAALAVAMGADAAGALGFMKSMPADELTKVIEQSGYNWRLGNIAEFAAQLTQDTGFDPAAKQLIAARLFGRAIWSSPAEAQALLPFLSEGTLTGSIHDYMQSWARNDPAAAKAWAENLPEGPSRSAARDALTAFAPRETASGRTGPESLGDALKQGEYVGPDDPRIAQLTGEQIGRIFTDLGKNQNHGMRELMQGLVTNNPKAGAAWLETAVIDDRKTGPVAARFSSQWAENDPAAAAAWVKTLPSGDLARTAAWNVARQYRLYAPAEAAAWLGTLSPGPVQEAARKGMANP